MNDITKEDFFQAEIENELLKIGWLSGESKSFDQVNAVYKDDLITFFTSAYPEEWEKYKKFFSKGAEENLLKFVISEIDKNPRGVLDILRGDLRDRGVKIRLTAPYPSHGMSQESLDRFNKNIFRVVREVVYSPNGSKNRIDLVLFLNGFPIATIETKSEFKQDLQNAIKQYKEDRLPIDPATKKREPLLTFKRGALVHFAVGENEIYMTTKLEGWRTFFLPFNKGKDGFGAGNKIPESGYPIKYFWEEILQKESLIKIIHNFIHLDRKQEEDESGRIFYKESLIFPRYHQLEAVNLLLNTAHQEGPGHTYLIQHSAGSGKSNSIAWLAHQLANLYKEDKRVFDTVIVVTDRRVLDSQLQDTIFQFEHKKGVVSRIGHKDELNRSSSKSEQLAKDLINGTNIVIVTIQTFPFIVEAIRQETSLKDKHFAIIADEAHSSQTGKGAAKLKLALSSEKAADDEEFTSEDLLNEYMDSRSKPSNVSYFAFTATPKARTLEIFGRCPDPSMPISEENKPRPFHLYSMRQALEEGFIRDVLTNYTTYQVLYELANSKESDQQVDSKKAKKKIAQFARLHPYNISQKIQIMIEHFRENVAERLEGQAKGMVVTSSRKEAVGYKIYFDKYIKEKGYKNLQAIVAFSGEIIDSDYCISGDDGKLVPRTESNMNNLAGRDIPEALDSEDFQLLLVANKYQTGFDQPKLCAMYVDKKLGGVDCVQTLSRLNRTYPGKQDSDIFILDFCNDPKDIEEAFKPYYGETQLGRPSNPNLVYEIKNNILEADFIHWHEVEQFCASYDGKKENRSNLNKFIQPAVERFNTPYKKLIQEITELKKLRKTMDDQVQKDNIETRLREASARKDNLDKIKKYCTTYLRAYDFITQIIHFDDLELEKFYVYLQAIVPMLKTTFKGEDIDLSGITLSKYRIRRMSQARINLNGESTPLDGMEGAGTGSGNSEKEERFSEILRLINELSGASELTEADKVKYLKDIEERLERKDGVIEQIKNNTKEQMIEGKFKEDLTNIIIENMSTNEKHKTMGEDLLGKDNLLDSLAEKILERLYEKHKK